MISNFGRLGVADLTQDTFTTIYPCPENKQATVTISICNRNDTPVVIDIAIVDGGIEDIVSEDYIEYQAIIDGYINNGNVLIRTGEPISGGESVIVRSDKANVSVRVSGVEEG